MLGSVFLAVALGIGAYAAAERKGRSPSGWLIVVACVVLASYYVASLLASGLATSNTIFSDSGQVLALAAVLAAPLAGLIAGGSLVAWIGLGAPVAVSFSKPVRMYGGYDGAAPAELWVHFNGNALIVATDSEQQRLERHRLQDAKVDGEYVVIKVVGESGPLMLRASGDAPGGRDGRVALAEALALGLRQARR